MKIEWAQSPRTAHEVREFLLHRIRTGAAAVGRYEIHQHHTGRIGACVAITLEESGEVREESIE